MDNELANMQFHGSLVFDRWHEGGNHNLNFSRATVPIAARCD
jgi:hypothetical protein